MDFLTVAAVVIGGYVFVRWMSRRRNLQDGVDTFGSVEPAGTLDLDALFASSDDHALLFFLHDPWCPISVRAARQIAQVEVDVVTIDVSREHDLSRSIERRTGVRHESPQAILIVFGVTVWSESHSGIVRHSIEDALAATPAWSGVKGTAAGGTEGQVGLGC